MTNNAVLGGDTTSWIENKTVAWTTNPSVWNIASRRVLFLISDEDMRNPPSADFIAPNWNWLKISDEDIRQEKSSGASNKWGSSISAEDWNHNTLARRVDGATANAERDANIAQTIFPGSTQGAIFISDEDLRHASANTESWSQRTDWSWLKISDEDLR